MTMELRVLLSQPPQSSARFLVHCGYSDMKKTFAVAIGSVLLGAGGALSVQTDTTEVIADKNIVLTQNVELHSRLGEPPVWNASVISSEEMTNAYTKVAEKYNVTVEDIRVAGGNIQLAIQEKLRARSLMCK